MIIHFLHFLPGKHLYAAQLLCLSAIPTAKMKTVSAAQEILKTAQVKLQTWKSDNMDKIGKGLPKLRYNLTAALWNATQGALCFYQYQTVSERMELLDDSLRYSLASLHSREKILQNHTEIARLYDQIGSVYLKKQDFDRAIEFYEMACHMRKSITGSELHPDCLTFIQNLASAFQEKGKRAGDDDEKDELYMESSKTYEHALDVLRQLKLDGTIDEAIVLRNIANLYLFMKIPERAIDPSLKAQKIVESFQPKGPLNIKFTYLVGLIFMELKNYPKAVLYLRRAFVLEEDSGSEHTPVRKKIRQKLLKALEKAEFKGEYRKYKKKIDEIEVSKKCLHSWVSSCHYFY